MENLAEYRMNSYHEIKAYYLQADADNFKAYCNRIYGDLMAMYSGTRINILKDVAPENREKFIKICCLFISEGNSDFTLTDDYTMIKRLSEKPENGIVRFKQKLALKKKNRQDELDKAKGTNNQTA